MIKAKFSRDDDALRCTLSVEGHAGFAERGEDIICASASILLYTIAQLVKAMEEHGDFAEEPIVDITDGKATVSCICKNKDDYAEVVYAYFVVQTGYSLLEQTYPQYVELTMFGEA